MNFGCNLLLQKFPPYKGGGYIVPRDAYIYFMFRLCIIFLFSNFIFTTAFSQQKMNADSVRTYISSAASDTGKVNRAHKIYNDYLWQFHREETFQFLKDGLLLASSITFRKGAADLYKFVYAFSLNMNSRDFDDKYNNECLRLRLELNDALGVAACYFSK